MQSKSLNWLKCQRGKQISDEAESAESSDKPVGRGRDRWVQAEKATVA